MRVLHIAAGNLYGGVETLLVTLARCRRLCPAMEPEFALCFEGRLSQELTETCVAVHRLGAVKVRNPLRVRTGRQKLAGLIRDRRFDAVICHSSWPHAIFAPIVRAAGCRWCLGGMTPAMAAIGWSAGPASPVRFDHLQQPLQ